jgi:hypothetical protein
MRIGESMQIQERIIFDRLSTDSVSSLAARYFCDLGA